MRPLLALLCLLAFAAPAAAALPEPFDEVQFLVGDWDGSGTGKPGEGQGSFSFKFDLGNKVLVRRSFAQYPPRPGQTEGMRHDDLMILYYQPGSPALKAMYFDNEGHVIHYGVTVQTQGQGQSASRTATFESEGGAGDQPRFKLVYEQTNPALLKLTFSLAPPGKSYLPYISATARRAAPK